MKFNERISERVSSIERDELPIACLFVMSTNFFKVIDDHYTTHTDDLFYRDRVEEQAHVGV
jgi:hypothetical protein